MSQITNYIKENDPEVVWVKYDWDSVKVGDSGAFTESGFDIRLKVYGRMMRKSTVILFFYCPKTKYRESNFNRFNFWFNFP